MWERPNECRSGYQNSQNQEQRRLLLTDGYTLLVRRGHVVQ